MPTDTDQKSIAELKRQLAERTAERDEAWAQQAATSEVLKIVSSSRGELAPVFQAILKNAIRICEAKYGHLLLVDGNLVRLAAEANMPRQLAEFFQRGPFEPTPGSHLDRVRRTKRMSHTADDTLEPVQGIASRYGGARSIIAVPMLKDDALIGVILIYRQEVRPFTDQQIALLENFANQAVIAVENARLFNEAREALARQTATAEILEVINSSPSDLVPVFDTILQKARELCGIAHGSLQLYDGTHLRAVAVHGTSERFAKILRQGWPVADLPAAQALLNGERYFQIDDARKSDFEAPRRSAELEGTGTILGIPLCREGRLLGAIFTTRYEVKPFTEKEISLLESFAVQAAIAIENARLFNETKEALARQTATADVLKVIASSPSSLQPVFDAIAERSNQLIGGHSTTVIRFVGDMAELAAFTPISQEADAALRAQFPRPIAAYPQLAQVHRGETAEIADTESVGANELNRNVARARGFRSRLMMPLRSENDVIGAISITRKEPGAFAEQHVELLRTFADQAVIAIENIRLFEEVQAKTRDLTEALTYQTGSANILRVIASSPTDVKPVLKAIVESACELCGAYDALVSLKDGDDLRFSAHHGPIPIPLEKWPINRKWVTGRAVVDRVPIHVHDLPAEGDDFPEGRELARLQGHRTVLSVPLLREGESVGAISLRRIDLQPFSEKQITLLQSFADQAVIAIGNVRLFEEVQARTEDLRESLQFQTATSDVLKVISSSPDSLQPVLDVIVETSRQLCGTETSTIFLLKDDKFHIAAASGAQPEYMDFLRNNPIALDQAGSSTSRAAREKRTVHIPDIGADPEFGQGPMSVGQRRALLSVPLMREGAAIGVITMRQTHLTPFTERQIEVVQTFADQAVIAISNVRLFEEVQARTRDLTESLQQQTATADVLRVISASPGELEPVFEAMLENAVRLCEAKFAMLFFYEDNEFRAVGRWNLPSAYSDFLGRNTIHADPMIPLGRVAITKQPVQVADVLADQSYIQRYSGIVAVAELGGARTLLQVPMLKEKELVGTIGIYRQEVRPFTDKLVALVQNFAAQAVIAIENARLLNELRQRTNDLTASLENLRTAQDRLIQTEKLASLGQLTAGIAHEIKNPLNFVNNFSALSVELTDELNDVLKQAALADKIRVEVDELTGTLKDNLGKVVQHGKRADSIVKNMLLHSREGSGEHRPADVNALVDESLNLAYHGARAEKPQFNVTLMRNFDPEAGQIEVFPQEITRVLLNLISNGFYAVTRRKADNRGADFEPTVRATTLSRGDRVEIRIRDNGTGIPPHVKEKMFNPFFTTKPAGEGTGLGLSMSHDIIVKQHGGTIEVETEPGEFTEFTIILPRTKNHSNRT